MGYFNTDQLENDDAMTQEYQERVIIAERFLDTAVYQYQGHPTPANRTRLVKAARDYSGAQGDLALVTSTIERH